MTGQDQAAETQLLHDDDPLPRAWLAERGAEVHALRRRQVLFSPARTLSVVYDATLDWPDRGPADEVVAAVADLSHPDTPVRLWLYPHDPELPGLARLADPGFVRDLCGDAGLPEAGVNLASRAYRPGRRAVVAVTSTRDRPVFDPAAARVALAPERKSVYVKALRPGEAAGVRDRLDQLAGRVPVPGCHVCRDDLGLLVLEGLPGVTLHDLLRSGAAKPPDGEALLELLDRLGTAAPDGRAQPRTTADRVRRHARLLATVVPDQAERIARFVRRLGGDAPEPVVTAHNDFYDSQLLVDANGAVVGLLDVDGVGPGHRTDDLARMLGRVWTAGVTSSRGREAFSAYARRLFDSFADVCDTRELCRRTAGVVFGRATGPFRAQQRDWPTRTVRRIDLAERWLEATAVGEPPPAG